MTNKKIKKNKNKDDIDDVIEDNPLLYTDDSHYCYQFQTKDIPIVKEQCQVLINTLLTSNIKDYIEIHDKAYRVLYDEGLIVKYTYQIDKTLSLLKTL